MQTHRSHSTWLAAAAITMTLAVTACGSDSSNDDDPESELANPASEYCVAQGGEVEIVEGADGETGMCNLPDGTSVDEWEYYRENNPDVTTP